MMTVWGMFQFAGVKVREVVLTVPSPVFEELTGMVTSPVGWLLRAKVKLAVPPDSLVVVPPTTTVEKPTVSLSKFVRGISAGSSPLKFRSELVAAPRTIV